MYALYWFIGLSALVLIFVFVALYYHKKGKQLREGSSEESNLESFLEEQNFIPPVPDVPQDVFKYNFDLWGSDGRKAMKIQAAELLGIFVGFCACYFWGLFTLFGNLTNGIIIISGGGFGAFLSYALLWLIIDHYGNNKIGHLNLLTLELSPQSGKNGETGRFHILKVEEITGADFTKMLDNPKHFEGLKAYAATKQAFKEELELWKRDNKNAEPPAKELKRLQTMTNYTPRAYLDIQLSTLEILKTPLIEDFVKQATKLQGSEGLRITQLQLAHPSRPNDLAIRLNVLTKDASFSDHLGEPKKVMLYLWGNSFKTKEFDLDMQVRYQGRNLVSLTEIIKSDWRLQHPKNIFEQLTVVTAEEAHYAGVVSEIWDSMRLTNVVKEQGRIIAEQERNKFNFRAEVYKEVANVLRLGNYDLKGILSQGTPLFSPTQKTIVISLVGAALIIAFIVFLIWVFGGF